jgi:hypothetical protein
MGLAKRTQKLGVGFAGLITIANLTSPAPVRADAAEAAAKHLNQDQRDLKDAAVITRAQASKLANDATAPGKGDALLGELQDFSRTTERLTTLRDRLGRDIARNTEPRTTAQLEQFDQKRGQITSAATQRLVALRVYS